MPANRVKELLAITSLALAHGLSAQGPDGPRQFKPQPTTAAITSLDIKTREYIIADDSMQGRETGKFGGLRSAQYIAAELKRLGVEPAGENGSYFQAIPWLSQRPDPNNTLRVGATALNAATDFLLVPRIGFAAALGGQPFGAPFTGDNVASVFGGRIGDSTIAPDAAQGKVVVFAPPADRASFQFWQRDNLRRYAGAKALLVAVLDIASPQQMQQYRAARETYHDSTLTGAAAPMTVIAITAAAASQILGAPIGSAIRGMPGLPVSGTVRFLSTPTEAPAYNVVGIVRGSSARLRNTYVAVGMHHDHVGMTPRPLDHDSVRAVNAIARPRGGDDRQARRMTDAEWAAVRITIDSLHKAHGGARLDSINNGADDDGSGVVLGLEIAEALTKSPVKPARSVLLVFHTAEEKGLYGAQYYSDHTTVPRDSIVAQVNLDQVGRGDPEDNPPSGPNALVLIGTRRLSTELGALVEAVNERPEHGFKLDYQFDADGDPNNGYCRSDHYMYARYGIPAAFFVSAVSYRDLHMVSDEPQYIAFDREAKIGRYAYDVVRAVANLEHRPVVDKPRPDPNALCRQ